jgi:two-component system, NtrC family, response regulator GlrR
MSNGKLRILIVEDDPAVLAGMAAALDEKMVVDTCESAEAALPKLARNSYNVVCADYGLPNMSGLELLEELAKRRPPVRGVLVTGSEDSYKISKRRGYYVLKKPFDPERLMAIVEHLAALSFMRQSVVALTARPTSTAGRK